MLSAKQLRVAIVMTLRAPCKGDEAVAVASTLQALNAQYEMEAAKEKLAEEQNGD